MEELDSKEKDIYGHTKASKFHFKSTSQRSSKRKRHSADDHESDAAHHSSDPDHHARRSHRDRKRRRRKHHESSYHTSTRSGDYDNPDHRHRESLFDGIDELDGQNIDSEAKFRESLFDAMADDEGADYWESVYGQPVHIYPNTKKGPDGKLERMTDEEYADYVRTKMWEKTHQHILEEREAREKARQERKAQSRHLEQEAAKEEEEREKIRRQMDESLKRGAERKKAKENEAAWAYYLKRWDKFRDESDPESNPRDLIPWPVTTGKASHVERGSIERFFKSSRAWKEDALALLKTERVRWHPDRMQRRFGQSIDSETMKLVTAVFQVIDQLWNERNSRSR